VSRSAASFGFVPEFEVFTHAGYEILSCLRELVGCEMEILSRIHRFLFQFELAFVVQAYLAIEGVDSSRGGATCFVGAIRKWDICLEASFESLYDVGREFVHSVRDGDRKQLFLGYFCHGGGLRRRGHVFRRKGFCRYGSSVHAIYSRNCCSGNDGGVSP
jgi:hypothetical protein